MLPGIYFQETHSITKTTGKNYIQITLHKNVQKTGLLEKCASA